ncbi:V-type ATP synthase subunit I [Clostridium sp. C2-6-12]|uniref:V-type ATP synthase subunit I n=1 Tax=Clostridium sp. C2-6-12 TaxID=2698832 RepID=UPI00136E04BF|nr:V-type ATP synthase subunit I [Clostridium sp. C2-6-12]
MAIVKMNKFTLLAFESKKEELLEKLQAFSNAELINLQDENLLENNEILKDLTKEQIDSDLAKWEEQLVRIKLTISFLENYMHKQSRIKSLTKEKTSLTMSELKDKVLNSKLNEVFEKIREYEVLLNDLDKEKTRLKVSVEKLTPYVGFNAPFSSLKELKQVSYFLGSVPSFYEDNIINDLKDCYIEIMSKDDKETYFFALVYKEDEKDVLDVLRTFSFTPFKLEEEDSPLKIIHDYNERISIIDADKFIIKERLAGYEEEMKILQLAYEYYNNLIIRKNISNNLLKTENVTVIQGWIPESKNDEFTTIIQNILEEEYYLNFEEVKEEEIDDVPIKLENNDLNESFEAVTGMYSLPKYNDIDPTPFVTPFYLTFFGMMVADAGYGLLMLISTLVSLKFFKLEENTKKMVKFFMYLSFPTITFGLMYGSVFGDIIKFNGLIDSSKDFMTILVLSFVFGIIQIFFGMGIKAVLLIRMGKPLEAFMDVGSWVITLLSFGGIGAGTMLNIPVLKTICTFSAIVGALLIVFTQGRSAKTVGGKIGQGLYQLYGITSYLGDLVSYARLMAIGLSGGSIAGAINMIIKMLPAPIGLFVIGPILFVIFQTVNLLLSLLSGYVHSLRLTYVEYFSKFYDGGGKPFKPFETQTKYINLKRD